MKYKDLVRLHCFPNPSVLDGQLWTSNKFGIHSSNYTFIFDPSINTGVDVRHIQDIIDDAQI
jgi:fructosamine-3-kinase